MQRIVIRAEPSALFPGIRRVELSRLRADRCIEIALEVFAVVAVVWLLAVVVPRFAAPAEEEPLPSQGCLGSSSAGVAPCVPLSSSRRFP